MTLPISKIIPGLKHFKVDADSMAVRAAAKHSVGHDRLVQPTGIVHTAAAGAGIFGVNIASNVRVLLSELADGNTKTSVAHLMFALPANYKAAGTITLRVTTKLKSVTGTGVTDNGSDIDASAYKQAVGAVGSDLVTTNAQTYAALDTWYTKTFVVTPTGLVAGDVVNFVITTRAIESNVGNGTLQNYVGEVSVLCDTQ